MLPATPTTSLGPRALFRDGKLFLADEPALAIPPGEWFHLEIVAGFGPDGDGTWRPAVTLPDGTTRRFEALRFGSRETNSVTWIGFISSGDQACTYYLTTSASPTPRPRRSEGKPVRNTRPGPPGVSPLGGSRTARGGRHTRLPKPHVLPNA